MQVLRKFVTTVLLLLPLGGCITNGTAEYSLQGGGKVPTAQLERARATCRMRVRDNMNNQLAAGIYVTPVDMTDDARDCFLAQGIELKGWRQHDGSLTRYPIDGGQANIIEPKTAKR